MTAIKATAPVLLREAALWPVLDCGLKMDGGAWYELSDGFRYVLSKQDYQRLSQMIGSGRFRLNVSDKLKDKECPK